MMKLSDLRLNERDSTLNLSGSWLNEKDLALNQKD
jgi:hypothetical protein